MTDHLAVKLHSTFDAQVWAKEFMILYNGKFNKQIDEDLMLSWFANSLMRGYDRAHQESQFIKDRDEGLNLISNQLDFLNGNWSGARNNFTKEELSKADVILTTLESAEIIDSNIWKLEKNNQDDG